MTNPTTETEDVVALAVLKAVLVHGTNNQTWIAPEDAKHIGRAAIEASGLSERIAVLEGLLVKYGDRVRMATAWPESVQPAIDQAFENEQRRASITLGGNG